MRSLLLAAVIAGILPTLFVSGVAVGADTKWKASADRGRQIAERLCASCHLMATAATRSAVAGVPSFKAIANAKGRTKADLRSALIKPHKPMPDTQLTIHEIGDLLAYIESLRLGGKPKSKNGGDRPKPTYPSPS